MKEGVDKVRRPRDCEAVTRSNEALSGKNKTKFDVVFAWIPLVHLY